MTNDKAQMSNEAQTPNKSLQNEKRKVEMQNDRATVNKKLKCKKQSCKERCRRFNFCVLICHFDF
jgi:hypothetical protein